MRKWEYKIIKTYFSQETLNSLGKEGWELVAVVYKELSADEFYLKREII